MKFINLSVSIFVGFVSLFCCYKFFTIYDANYLWAMLCSMFVSIIFYCFFMMEALRDRLHLVMKDNHYLRENIKQMKATYRF